MQTGTGGLCGHATVSDVSAVYSSVFSITLLVVVENWSRSHSHNFSSSALFTLKNIVLLQAHGRFVDSHELKKHLKTFTYMNVQKK